MSAHNLPWRVVSGQAINCHNNIVLTRHSWRALDTEGYEIDQNGRAIGYRQNPRSGPPPDKAIMPTQADDNLKAIVQAMNEREMLKKEDYAE